MNDLRNLIHKHRAHGLLIDTNLLLVLLIGRLSRRKITSFERTQSYTIRDYELLEQFVSQFRQIVTTPHILTEVSNLGALKEKELSSFRTMLRDCVTRSREFLDESKIVVEDVFFGPFGITDAAISHLSGRGFLVLTDDFRLAGGLVKRGIDALNFNHIRWSWDALRHGRL